MKPKAHDLFILGTLNLNHRDHRDFGATIRRIFKCVFSHSILGLTRPLQALEDSEEHHKALEGVRRPLRASEGS